MINKMNHKAYHGVKSSNGSQMVHTTNTLMVSPRDSPCDTSCISCINIVTNERNKCMINKMNHKAYHGVKSSNGSQLVHTTNPLMISPRDSPCDTSCISCINIVTNERNKWMI